MPETATTYCRPALFCASEPAYAATTVPNATIAVMLARFIFMTNLVPTLAEPCKLLGLMVRGAA